MVAPFEAPPRAPRPQPQDLPAGPLQPDALPQEVSSGLEEENPKTSVLALNQGLNWAQKIGDDAELLAIAQATGLKPRSPLRALAVPVLILAVVLGGLAFAKREQLPQLWRRIVEQREVTLGSVVVKSYPSGAQVRVDGKRRGATPIRIDNIDIDVEHTVVVAPVGEPEVRRSIGPGDWEDDEGQMLIEIRIGYDKLPDGQKLADE